MLGWCRLLSKEFTRCTTRCSSSGNCSPMLSPRNVSVHIFVLAIIIPTSFSSELWPTRTEKNDAFCNYGESKSVRFFPGLSADIGVHSNPITEQDEQCYNDSRVLQLNALNYTLWASLMMDATAAYPTGVLHGSRYHFGNFDECMTAAKKSPVGARYCLARLTYNDERLRSANGIQSWFELNDLDPNTDVRYVLQGLGQDPQGFSAKYVWVGVCVPRSCSAVQVQRTMQQELQLWHPNIAAVDIPSDMCTDEESSLSVGLVIYSLVIAGLIGIAVTATVWEINGVVPSGRMGWIMYWSVPRRFRGLVAPEKLIRGVPLQSLAGLRTIGYIISIASHYCLQIPKTPLLNVFITHTLDPILVILFQSYLLLHSAFFVSGLLLALGSRDSFFRSIILRYLRLTPSHLAVIAFYAVVFPSLGSGPLWKSMVNPEAEGCSNLWWANLLYLNNFILPNSTHGCVIQSWSLAPEMQLFILGTLFLTVEKKWKKTSMGILISAILISMWTPFFSTLRGIREPTWRFTPSVLEVGLWSWPLWDKYVSTEQWTLSYLLGLATGLLLEKSVKEGVSISLRTKVLVLSGALLMFILLMISGTFWRYTDLNQHSIVAAFYATTIPVVWSISVAFVVAAFALGPTWLDDFLKSSVFVIINRLWYSIYLIHFGAQIAHVALMRAPRYVSDIDIITSSFQELILYLPLCLLMYLLIEAPVRELSKDLFRPKNIRPQWVSRLQPPASKDT